MHNLLTKHRPATWEALGGDPEVNAAVEACARENSARSILLTGPSGVGKTTIARLIAAERNVLAADLVEVDAASRSGVADVRALTSDLVRVRPMGLGSTRCIVVDECHRLSPQAWDALLKTIEDCPSWVTWVFATTEPGKVPRTVKTRCATFELDPLSRDQMKQVLMRVCKAEGYQITGKVAGALIDRSEGSPRAMLASLAALNPTAEEEQQLRSLDSWQAKSLDAIELVKSMCQGKSAKLCLKQLQQIDLKSTSPEAIRQIALRFASALALKGDAQAVIVLEAFREPFPPSDYPLAHLILSVTDATS
jgi:DNA polymerase-3 subunit gamma/tau